jgi:TPR repeat protein
MSDATDGGVKDQTSRTLFARAKKLYNCGVREDWPLGLELLKQAAAQGHVGAHEWLGGVYDYGLGTRRNRRLALKHYKTAADAGSPKVEHNVGALYLDLGGQENYKTAIQWLRKAAS